MESDVKLEKFLDLMADEMRMKLGNRAVLCPMYQWVQEALEEVRVQNNSKLRGEFPLPQINVKLCGKCVLK